MTVRWYCDAPDEYDDPFEAEDFCSPDDPGDHPERHHSCGYFERVDKEEYDAEGQRLFLAVQDLQKQLAAAEKKLYEHQPTWRYLGKNAPENT